MLYRRFLPLWMLIAIVGGGVFGYLYPQAAQLIEPMGAIFLNLLLSAVVPYVFFAVLSACSLPKTAWLNLSLTMGAVFLITSMVAGLSLVAAAKIYSLPMLSTHLATISLQVPKLGEQIVDLLTVKEFMQLFSPQHLLALIFYSILCAVALKKLPQQQQCVQAINVLQTLFSELINLIMYAAPLGFFCYFGAMIGHNAQQLVHNYLQIIFIYYLTGISYFFIVNSIYVYLARGFKGVKNFWYLIWPTALTAMATCSSAASIPVNIEACEAMKVPKQISQVTIPLGSFLHKQGSVMGGMTKIVFLYAIAQQSFNGFTPCAVALILSVLVGTVMGAIPSGGMLGELLIIAYYGLPNQALLLIAVISILIDPLATMINVVGNTTSSLLIARFLKNAN